MERYALFADEPDVRRLRIEVEAYQAQLDVLGLKDHQLSHRVSAGIAMKRIVWRTTLAIALFPLALPGAIILLPGAWLAATVGSRFSYDFDDIATLKLVTAVPVLLSTYVIVTILAGMGFGWVWAIAALLLLPASFFATLFCVPKAGPTAHLHTRPASLGAFEWRHRSADCQERGAGDRRTDRRGPLRGPHHSANFRCAGFQRLGGRSDAVRVDLGHKA